MLNDFNGDNEFVTKESLDKLHKALDYFKGHEIVADTLNGFATYQVYEDFDYSLFSNVKEDILLNFKDNDDKSESISFKLNEVMDIEIDDNEKYLDKANEEYECENIIITLWNYSKLRLEFQW